jgi:3-oxoacyl-[acyl-carrier protein] reductase
VEKLEAVAAEIVAAGGTAKAYALDVSSEESIRTAAKAVLADHGAVHILVNNAGITKDGLALRMKLADFDDVLRTNLTGAFLLTQAVISSMMKARWGRVINITSVVGETGRRGRRTMRRRRRADRPDQVAGAGVGEPAAITVNAVAPGFIETAMTGALTDEQKAGILAQIPLARYGADADIAAAVAYLASDGAGYITGHTLDVNGGLYMG